MMLAEDPKGYIPVPLELRRSHPMSKAKRNPLGILFTVTVCAACVSGCGPANPEEEPFEADASADIAAIRSVLEDYLSDWEVGDSASLAPHFDTSFDWMNPVGMVLSGSAAVAQFQGASHAAQDSLGIARSLSLDVTNIRLITPDVALVDLSYTQVGPRPLPPPGTARSFIVFVKRDGKWLRAAQRNFRLLQGG